MRAIYRWIFAVASLIILITAFYALSLKRVNEVALKNKLYIDRGKILFADEKLYYAHPYYSTIIVADMNGNTLWRFKFNWDEYFVDFTYANHTLYSLTDKNIYILNANGTLIKSENLMNISNLSNHSKYWPLEIWPYENHAYLRINSTIYEFAGTDIVNKYKTSLPNWQPDNVVRFGPYTLLVLHRGTNYTFYSIAGHEVLWNVVAEGYSKYATFYPYIVLYSDKHICIIKDGETLWSLKYESYWIRGVAIGNDTVLVGVWDYESYGNYQMGAYEYTFNGKQIRNFVVNYSSISSGKYVFKGIIKGNEVIAIGAKPDFAGILYYNSIFLFGIPYMNGTTVYTDEYMLNHDLKNADVIKIEGNTFYISWGEDYTWGISIFSIYKITVFDFFNYFEYKLLILIIFLVSLAVVNKQAKKNRKNGNKS